VGDRTFSADDVLRIYREYLDEREMIIVEEFFMEDVDNSLLPFVAVRNLLAVLEPLALILGSTAIAILASAFGPARIALALALPVLAGIIRILRIILATEDL